MIVVLMETPASLIDRLRHCADLWVAAKSGSPAMLGRLVVNDGGYFSRIESNASTTTATLEKFARFLIDPGSWPGGHVPEEVHAFAHVVGVCPPKLSGSAGKADEFSRDRAA